MRLVELGISAKSGVCVSWCACNAVLSRVAWMSVCSKALGNELIFAVIVFVGVEDKVVAVIWSSFWVTIAIQQRNES